MNILNKYDMIDDDTSDDILLEILNEFSVIKPKKPSLLDALTFSPNFELLKEVDKMKKGKLYLVKSKYKEGSSNEMMLAFGKFSKYDENGCIIMKKCILYDSNDNDMDDEYYMEPYNYVRYSKKYNFCIDEETTNKKFIIYEFDKTYIERKSFLEFSEGIKDENDKKEEKKRLRYLTNRETQKEISSFLGGKRIIKINKTKKNKKCIK